MTAVVKAKKAKVVKRVVISPNNTKLGKIPSFSLPAINSCPGRTTWCSNLCYADKVARIYKNAEKSYYTNMDATTKVDFVSLMNDEIAKLVKKNIKTFRIHVSGDFYDVKYIYRWVSIIQANPEMMFYGYTRSWSVDNLLPHLETLRCLPNVILFASTDDTTVGTPPATWREAYAGDTKPNGKKMVTCLEQAGKVATCDKCKICFNHKSTLNIHFIPH
ncbi:MAG: hypothetical protein JHC33_07170 [Ignisphaera sp.]|nr:hypothetical protein [Ignisphaera sp.]